MKIAFLKAQILRILIICTGALYLNACAPQRPPVPVGEIPKPKKLSVTEEQYGHKVLAQLTEKYKLDYDHPRRSSVDTIVARLAKAARADNDPWHVFVFKDDKFKNAAATRGNHVFIWTAMIDATQNDEELAAILAHEIGHVLARHTDPDPNEAVRKMLINVGAMAAGIAATQAVGSGQAARAAGQIASSMTNKLGSGILVNPYSREREYEADQIGLFMMADAGYNPQSAINFWQRAQSDPSFGGGAIAFFSTHPPAGPRLERLREYLPMAQARFRGEAPAKKRWADRLPKIRLRKSTDSQRPKQVEEQPAAVTVSGNPWDIRSTKRNQNPRRIQQWIVKAPKAVLYENADINSRAIGEFARNAFIESRESSNGWIKISYPDIGYIQQNLLQPAVRN